MTLTAPLLEAPIRPGPIAMRSVLLGCGVVGGGVAAHLPQGVRLGGVLARTRRSDMPSGIPVFTRLSEIQALRPQLVIETLPGGKLAEDALEWAVGIGAHVVTANKAAAARRPDLAARAKAQGTAFACSAAVGGGVPVLESIARLKASGARLTSVRGVLNGTSNFVLDRLASGESLDLAIGAAQAAGFAESDPSADIDGRDAANKLALIARAAWDIEIDPDQIGTETIRDLRPDLVPLARTQGRRYRQVARLDHAGGTLHASVKLVAVGLDDPLARATREDNVVALNCADRAPLILSGKGAGREPTAASVLGDIRRILAGRW